MYNTIINLVKTIISNDTSSLTTPMLSLHNVSDCLKDYMVNVILQTISFWG